MPSASWALDVASETSPEVKTRGDHLDRTMTPSNALGKPSKHAMRAQLNAERPRVKLRVFASDAPSPVLLPLL